jgi:hypothetical protein
MVQSKFVVLLLTSLSCLAVGTAVQGVALAETVPAPWSKRCSTFQTPRQFVVESTMFCLKHDATKECKQKAARFFQGCRFAGDYKKMSQRVQAKMLVVLALAGGASWRKGESM